MADTAHPPTEPPPDRFCDLVMKGGITSGVVYPGAIEQLSHHYHFKNIGGTSAGAIAAAVTAAAEYQRRCTGSRAGFDLLKTLPEELKTEVRPGQRKLLSLFQPQPATRRLFSVLVNALNSGSTNQRILAMVTGAIQAYWPAALGAAGLALLALATSGLLAALLMLLVAGVGLIGWMTFKDITGPVVDNGFGLCTGLGDDPQLPALTPWLHNLIQRAAGRQPDDAPLTFGALWAAPGHPPERMPPPAGSTRKSIDLQMFSTNLGHGRPYIFPLAEQSDEGSRFRSRDRLFFSQTELARYLPPTVLAWMVAHGRAYAPEPGREDRDPSTADAAAHQLMELPPARDFPVILAARMSLSFPLLFAALPLWAIDHDQVGRAPFRRCWFSDGGISSNFPMHLFDGLVPSWPTFGINLEDEIAGRPDTYLPDRYDSGYDERWNRFDHEATDGAARFGGFFSAILGAMQNWNDNALSRMPGVRDRIARVRLKPTEGGLNLNMEGAVIQAVAERGERAVLSLVARFVADDAAGAAAAGWDEQRWVRLGVLLKMIQERAPGVLTALDPALPHATPLHTLIERAGDPAAPPPPGYEAPLTPAQQAALLAVVNALGVLVGTLAAPACRTDFKPVPRPELRVRPPL
ncbi:MAG: patatin-like phospholipase family protein [Pseudomonadota bacterium]